LRICIFGVEVEHLGIKHQIRHNLALGLLISLDICIDELVKQVVSWAVEVAYLLVFNHEYRFLDGVKHVLVLHQAHGFQLLYRKGQLAQPCCHYGKATSKDDKPYSAKLDYG